MVHLSTLTKGLVAVALIYLVWWPTPANGQGVGSNRSSEASRVDGLYDLLSKAKAGDVNAMYSLGHHYFVGQGVAEDHRHAVTWWRKAGEAGHAVAMYNLGVCYANGQGVEQDHRQAVEWYRKAAEAGNADAMLNLGACYTHGDGVEQDHHQAVECYRKAVKLGNVTAMYNLGVCYDNGTGVKQDHRQAVEWYRKAAEVGQVNAMYNLGVCYANGDGVKQDHRQAAEWYRKAANTGNANAMYNFGACYTHGHGVKQDHRQAVEWYRRAADVGNAVAMYNMGLSYANGQGVEQDHRQAVEWFRRAAGTGDVNAMFKMGACYEDGHGVAQDHRQAVEWFRKAAEAGHADAMFWLALEHQIGDDVSRSISAAIDWFSQAGQAYLKLNNRDKALICYDNIRRLSPSHHLAKALHHAIYGNFPETEPIAAERRPQVEQARVISTGSGWVVSDGYVVTNHHVVADKTNVMLVRQDGVRIAATVAHKDQVNDLVLLKVADLSQLPPGLTLATRQPRLGEQIFTIGFPHTDIMGVRPKLTQGVVNATTGFGDDPRTIQISAAIQAGNSGGPVFNMRGEVVAVAVSKLDAVKVFKWTGDLPNSVGYAVKVGYLRLLLESADDLDFTRRIEPVRQGTPLEDVAAKVQQAVMIVEAQ